MSDHVSDHVLSVQNVSKVFGEVHTAVKAVDDVSLDVDGGQIALVMGPSGSGKTTLLSIAGGLMRPTSGRVSIDGVDITALSEKSLPAIRLKRIGFIFQAFNLLPALTALENVQVVMDFAGSPRKTSRERALQLLSRLGLAERTYHHPSQLSGGEKQRVAIARALANDPQLILADEPTANLDSKTGHEVVQLLREISSGEGRAIVIVSHDMRIMDIADRIMRLEDGRLSEGPMSLVTDPVCGMVITEEAAAATERFGGQDYFFCSKTCHQSFEAAPENFVMASPGRSGDAL